MPDNRRPPGTRLIQHPGAAPTLTLTRCAIEVEEGPDHGRTFELDRSPLSGGSDPSCDIVLTDDAVSKYHFELSMDDKGCRLRDLGSLNGTLVEGLRTVAVYLRDGAEIRIGATVLRFRVLEDDIEVAVSRRTNFGGLLGHSPALRAAFAILEQAARTDATVLILGESGTGKELAARALHDASKRKEGPYVVFDCAASTPTLIESQLFGHARGAFTGAADSRAGVFEEAHGGTLFLDELGELPIDLQPKLLRALETRAISRVGESKLRNVDVRFVAATNRNLDEEIRAGRFRQDLYYRLSVISARLPPLRERREEIPRLIRHFVGKLGGDPSAPLPASMMALLTGHDWPGNVRELRNVVERLITLRTLDPQTLIAAATPLASGSLGSGPLAVGQSPSAARTSPDDAVATTPSSSEAVAPDRALFGSASRHATFHEAKRDWTERFERAYLEALLRRHPSNISEFARVAGLSRQTCYRLLDKHGLRSD